MILNGPSYYQYKLLRRPAGPQERFDFGSSLAFFSAKVLRGGHKKGFLQLMTIILALVLVLKLLPHRTTDATYSIWSWPTTQDDDKARKALVEDDGSVPGGLRIVVFGGNDVATPARLPGRDTGRVDGRSWTELLCQELECSSYLSMVPVSEDPVSAMAWTKLYAASIDDSLNQTSETFGPGLDYNFMLDQFPVPWRLPDLSQQVTEFLSKKQPKHSPAETLWVFSFGEWDIWSLAAEPLEVSKPIIKFLIAHIIEEVERLYASALNATSIAWSDPDQGRQNESSPSSATRTGMPTPTATAAWIAEQDSTEERNSTDKSVDTEAEPAPDRIKHFRILIPQLFDLSLTPGWHDARPDVPAIHSKAEQMRNAATLTNMWNECMYSNLAEWIRTPEPKDNVQKNPEGTEDPDSETRGPASGKEVMRAFVESLEASSGRESPSHAALVAGHSRISPPPYRKEISPPPYRKARQKNGEVRSEENEDAAIEGGAKVDTARRPKLPQRDAILYDMKTYLEEMIVDRQLRNSGLPNTDRMGKSTEQGFLEVWKPCVGTESMSQPTEAADGDHAAEDGGSSSKRKRSSEPAIRGRTPTPSADTSEPHRVETRICDAPDDYLFFTPFTVSPRAVAVIARQAADMVRRNETMRGGWQRMRTLPPFRFVGEVVWSAS